MKRINIVLLFAAIWLFGMGWFSNRVFQRSVDVNTKVYIENDSLRKELSSKDSLILELGTEIDILEEDIQFREGEISYWGQKYDSLRWSKK